jgi:hypothetical protein
MTRKKLIVGYIFLLLSACAVSSLTALFISANVRYEKALRTKLKEMYQTVWTIADTEELASIQGTSRTEYKCIDQYIPDIKKRHDMQSMKDAFDACSHSFKNSFTGYENLSEGLRFGAFLTLISSRMSPYGDTHRLVTVESIISSPYTNCAPQSLLVAATLKHFYPSIEVRHVGIINKTINHSTVYAKDSTGSVWLDPTASVILVGPMEPILEGNPASIYNMIDYYEGNYSDNHQYAEAVDHLRRKYRAALRNGGIRKQDIVYDRPVTANYIKETTK